MCRFVSYVVPDGPPYYANGPMKAVTRCEEHDWMMSGPIGADSLCPIGRVEKAVEDGLAKIAKATEQ